MLQGGDLLPKKILYCSPNILSTGYNFMASLDSTHGRLLEQVECTDPLIYVKILAQFERIQFIMMEGFQTQLRDRPAKEDTVHFNFDLVNDRSANIRQMFYQLQLSNLQISVPEALTSALDKRTSPNPGSRDEEKRSWYVTKPADDSPMWLAGTDGRKSFSIYFGKTDAGRKNRAALANIKCKHHRSGCSNHQAGICADYLAGGSCTKSNCKLTHFLVRGAKQLTMGSDVNAKGLVQKLESFFAHL
jgi:hypothetical protein